MPRESIPIKVNYVASDNMISFVIYMRHAMAEDPCSYAYVYHDMVIFDDEVIQHFATLKIHGNCC